MSAPPGGETPSVGEPSSPTDSQTDTSRDADVHAFLIADVRGYTAFTQKRGDEDAGRLAGRFAEVTRAVVEDHRGRVLELRGDEALVVFGSPRSAIRGAVALQQRFVEETIADPSLPLTVGIGLDAGEAVPVEGGYRGGALNVAARLCSLARAGEVLASREIVHLARRIDGVRFTERGQSELKGLDQPVHVVAVRSEDRDEAQAIAPFVRSTAPPRRPWKAVAAVVALVVVAALVAVPLVARDSGGDSEIEPNSIGVLDPDSGDVTGTIGLEERPGSIAAFDDSVWVTNPDAGTVMRIDPDEQDVQDLIQVGQNPTGIATGFDAVWVVESGERSVSRISPDTNTVVDRIEVGNGPAGVAVGAGAVWVTNRFDGTISRLDPDGGRVITIPVGLEPSGIAVGFESVWVALSGVNRVVRVDPVTNSVTQVIEVGNEPGALGVSAHAVWVANTVADTVSRIDPDTSLEVDAIQVGDGPSGISVVQETVWVTNEWDGTLSRIEPGQVSARKIALGSVPQGLAGANGNLWVSVRGTATPHEGGTLRVVSRNAVGTLDTSVAYGVFEWAALHLIGDGLVAFEPTGGTNAKLVPNLATAIPTPTDGGRTYTFEVRSGIPYSNGEIVAPADFRHAIERGFRLDPSDFGDIYGGLVGGAACANDPRGCDLSEGIITDDAKGAITFNLVAPDPDFLNKLTMPFAYPVPPSVPDEEQVTTGIPGTGPYMLNAPMTDGGLVFVPNPHFQVWSQAARPDGYPNQIVWTFRVDPQAQVEAVAAGDADLAMNADEYGQLEELFVGSAAQVHTAPTPLTIYTVLNTRVPPFDNVDVRRAVNFAIDRDRIAEILGGEAAARPTCQQLPPNFPGYEPYCPYTTDPAPEGSWIGPDIEEAKRLVRRSGTAGMNIVIEIVPWQSQAKADLLGDYLIGMLKELGYRGRVLALSYDDFYDRRTEFQMAVDAWGEDYPAASNFITPFLTCDAYWIPSSGFCDPGIDTMIDRASQMQVDDPVAAGALWGEIDRRIVDQAPYLWMVSTSSVGFVSDRVGNYQVSPQWGVLVDQLWVR